MKTQGNHPRRTLGRGATRNVKGRFDRYEFVPAIDENPTTDDPTQRTTLTPENARTIITTNDSPDVPFDQSINPYRGCEHGCIYCFARPTHAYLDLSPGLDFETRILFKPNAAELLRRALAKSSYRCRPIAMGTNTDPYQPAERHLKLTRQILEVLAEHSNPVSVVTKSTLVTRDIDLLAPLAKENMASVFFSITTLDPQLARRMEPRAAAPTKRLEAMATVSSAGIPTGVLASPIIPALNDDELERILEAATESGARTGGYLLLRLPHEVEQLFTEWLHAHYPAKADKVLNRLREMRGGRLNDPRFEARHSGQGTHANLLRRRFELAARRIGFDFDRPALDCSKFRVPGRPGAQRSLFD